jgi:hypothetical protein
MTPGRYLEERDWTWLALAGLNVGFMQGVPETLPDAVRELLDLEGGAYIAGGSLVRALLGLWDPTDWSYARSDVDLWVRDFGRVMGLLRPTHNWNDDLSGSWQNHLVVEPKSYEGSFIDVVGQDYGHPAEVCARFDFRCAMLAFDGVRLWAAESALDDIIHRRLVPMRRTRELRIQKYTEMGLHLTTRVSAVVLPDKATREQVLGITPLPVGSTLSSS